MNCTPNLGHSHQRDRFRHFGCAFHKFSPIFNLWQTQQSWDWFKRFEPKNSNPSHIAQLQINLNFIYYLLPPRKTPNNTPFFSLHEHKINEFINLKVQSIFAKLQFSVKSISYSTQISVHVYIKKFYITTGTNPGFPMIYPKLLKIVFTCTLIFTWFSLRWSCMLINQHILVNFQLPLKHELVWLFW